MNGKAAVVLMSSLLFACVQAPPPQAAAPPPPPPAPTAAPPAPAALPAAPDRTVTIQRATCERFLELSTEDRFAASMFYIGYQSSRSRASTINVYVVPTLVALAVDYCEAHPNRTVAEAFAQAYWEVRKW